MKSYTLFSILLLAVSLFGFGQNQYRFDQVGLSQGLSSNKVFMTIEDEEGFIWIATDKGVDRYDGRTVKSYTLDRIDEIRRLNFVELFLAKDSSGKIWVLSNSDILQYYDTSQDAFVFYDQLSSTPSGNIYVGAYHIDGDNDHLVGSYNGVIRYNTESKSAKLIEGITGTVSSFIESSKYGLFAGSRDGIFLISDSESEPKNILTSKENWPSGRVDAMFMQESEDRLWIGTSESGLYSFNLKHSDLQKAMDGISGLNVPIRSIAQLSGGEYLIGTDGNGIFKWDAIQMKVLQEYTFDADVAKSLSSNSVYDININSQGVIFISTYRGGLNLHNPYKQNFNSISHQPGQSNSLANDVILSVIEPEPGIISFGTDKGVSQWDISSGKWQNISVNEKDDLKSPVVLAQDVDTEGHLIVASFNFSLSRFSKTMGRHNRKDIPDKQFEDLKIKSMVAHSNGEIFIGTTNQGLWSYDKNGEIKKYNVREPLALAEYSPSKLLIGNRDGLWMLDLQYDELTQINNSFLNDTLNEKVVVCILLDRNQNVWLGTNDQGVFRINFSSENFDHFSEQTGLASNSIFSLVGDDEGSVWVSSSEGISKINQTLIENYYPSDGVPSIDFNRNASLKDSEGRIYFGTNQGAILFDPKKIAPSSLTKKLVLTDFYLNHKLIKVGDESPLDAPINQVDKISLNYDQNSFSIAFTSIDFASNGMGLFEWKLDEFDDDWISEYGADRASYTNLNAGNYTFLLRLIDPTGKEIATPRSMEINITPPYWKAPPAYVLYTVLGIGLLILILYLNRLRLESRYAENQLHLLMDMAHEIKTPLTLIKAPLTDIISNNKVDEEVKESLGVALSSADKLHRQMMQFLDFKRISARKESLTIEKFDLIDLIRQKLFAFKVLAERKNISLEFEPSVTQFEIASDEKVLDKVISNLMSNSIKYTMENGMVTLKLEVGEGSWSLSVKDTGIGISKTDQKKIFRLFYRTDNARESGSTGSGVGLILAKDLAKSLGGDLELVASSSKGSTFKISMPFMAEEVAAVKPADDLEVHDLEDQVISEGDSRLKVLLVEDDAELRKYEKGRLGQKYQVTTASNGQEALDRLSENLPDLVISDVGMPKMNGRQLCMNIKSNLATSHIPVILLTGMSEKEHVMQGLESGADDYIVKPFDFDLLTTKIDNLLSSRKILKDKFIGSSDEGIDWEALNNEMDQQFIQEATKLVEENISDSELSVNFLCSSVGMSRTTFYHKLKSLIDLSPADFIRTIRLREAKKLLHNPKCNISEVAYSTGFMDAKYFATVFKKYYGITPSSYVSEHAKKG